MQISSHQIMKFQDPWAQSFKPWAADAEEPKSWEIWQSCGGAAQCPARKVKCPNLTPKKRKSISILFTSGKDQLYTITLARSKTKCIFQVKRDQFAWGLHGSRGSLQVTTTQRKNFYLWKPKLSLGTTTNLWQQKNIWQQKRPLATVIILVQVEKFLHQRKESN